MLEKRIYVSPPEAPIAFADGKLPPQFHVNVVTTVFEDSKQIGKPQVERVSYCRCADGVWRKDGGFRDNGDWVQSDAGRPADIEAALIEADAKTQAMWLEQVKHHGVMDHQRGKVPVTGIGAEA